MLGRPGKDCDFDAVTKKCAKTRVLERPVLQSRRRSASLPAQKKKWTCYDLAPVLVHRPRSSTKTARATVMRTKVFFMAIFDEKTADKKAD